MRQSVFAHYLNLTTSLAGQCERGKRKPSGPALELLSLVAKRGLAAVA